MFTERVEVGLWVENEKSSWRSGRRASGFLDPGSCAPQLRGDTPKGEGGRAAFRNTSQYPAVSFQDGTNVVRMRKGRLHMQYEWECSLEPKKPGASKEEHM